METSFVLLLCLAMAQAGEHFAFFGVFDLIYVHYTSLEHLSM